jgi:hypothetical protein
MSPLCISHSYWELAQSHSGVYRLFIESGGLAFRVLARDGPRRQFDQL